MKFDEIKKVNITVTQEDIEQMIKDKVKEYDPSIRIHSIEFERKLKPHQHIAVLIDADYRSNSEAETIGNCAVDNAYSAKKLEETETEVVSESQVETVEDIFADSNVK